MERIREQKEKEEAQARRGEELHYTRPEPKYLQNPRPKKRARIVNAEKAEKGKKRSKSEDEDHEDSGRRKAE